MAKQKAYNGFPSLMLRRNGAVVLNADGVARFATLCEVPSLRFETLAFYLSENCVLACFCDAGFSGFAVR